MSYCGIDDVKVVLRGTATSSGDVPGSATSLDDDQILQSIKDAQVEIDMALSQLYITPLNPVPDVVMVLTQDIAAYLADLIFRMSKPFVPGTYPLGLRYTRARAILDGIVKGQYYIDVTDDQLRTTTSEAFNPYCGDLITVRHLFGPALHGHSSFAVGIGIEGFSPTDDNFSENSLGLIP